MRRFNRWAAGLGGGRLPGTWAAGLAGDAPGWAIRVTDGSASRGPRVEMAGTSGLWRGMIRGSDDDPAPKGPTVRPAFCPGAIA